MTCYFVKFFCTPVNDLNDKFFQVISIDRLGVISCGLSLFKVERRADALSEE